MGGATVAMRVLDLVGTFLVLQFLSKEQVGVATTSWSVAVVLEAFNGLGVGAVVVRRADLSHHELSGLFWFATLLGAAATGLIYLAGPWLAAFYHHPELAPMFVVSAAKLIFVGASLVPLQLLSRDLQFRESGAVQTLASLGEAVTKAVLILAGFGAWSLVVANTARGFFLFIALLWFSPFRPQFALAVRSTAESIRFGLHVAASDIIYNAYRNADFLLLGRVLGEAALGVYRVAFDLGMTPLETVVRVVNRVQFPIYAKLQGLGAELRDAFFQSARSLLLVVGPVAALLTFASRDVLTVVASGHWLAALPMVQVLAWASLLRGLGLLFPQLFLATGRPEFAVYDAVITGLALVSGFVLALVLAPTDSKVLWVAWAWLLTYPVALTADFLMVRACAPITVRGLVQDLGPSLLGLALVTGALAAATQLRQVLASPILSLAVLILVALGTHAIYLRRVLHLRSRDLLPQRET